jgi:hypothetical protein
MMVANRSDRRNVKLFADFFTQQVGKFLMPPDGGLFTVCRIIEYRMIRSFPHEDTIMGGEMFEKLHSFHQAMLSFLLMYFLPS